MRGPNLEELLGSPNGKALEYKPEFASSKCVLRALVAFANAAGGRRVLGVEDGSRHVVGVAEPWDLEGWIASLVADAALVAESGDQVPSVGIRKLERSLVRAGREHAFQTYEGSAHGFFASGRPYPPWLSSVSAENLALFEFGCETARDLGATGVLDYGPLPPYAFPGDVPVVRRYDEDVLARAGLPS